MSNYSDSHFDESAANTSWYKVFHLVPEKAKVLDVGCSSGNFGHELITRKHCTVDGLELDKADAKAASKQLRKVFIKNVETDNLKEIDKDYDIIYFGDVIEHLVDPIAALKKIKNHLSPNGKILFSIPNMGHISIRLYLLRGDFDYGETGLLDKTHLHFYTLAEVQRVFAEAQLKIDHLDFVDKDYPKALVQKELKAAGLTGSAAFLARTQEPAAAAFQFVGTAKNSPVKLKPKKLIGFSPIDMFDTYHTNIVNEYERRIKALEASTKILKPVRVVSHQSRRVVRKVKRVIRRSK
jgi:2-polyprenyl-3-methyl-5-hydroxy-6-metoxy-1,4-benzoquinol methylase